MSKRWIIRRIDTELAQSIANSARIPELVASLLISRGMTTAEAATAFLGANLKDHLRSPLLLPGCKDVAQRLLQAIEEGKKIIVYGDYDVDGITGTAILYLVLQDLGADVGYYVPSRLEEGYGLNSDAIRRLATEDGVGVIITVDCGITSLEEAKLARRLGVELLITDHHNPEALLPDAAAIAHPQLVRFDGKNVSPYSLSEQQREQAQAYPFPPLCGAAVALKIAWGLGQLTAEGDVPPEKRRVAQRFRDRLKEMVGLAVLGTVADFVPLIDENRALVRSGIQFLHPSIASTGLKHLLKVSKYQEDRTRLDADFIAFQLAPRLNAAGRLHQASLAVELLVNPDSQRTLELAEYVNNLNESRKTLEKKINKEAIQQIEERFDVEHDSAFVLASPDWHKGVIGIVAGRLADRYHRPVILLGQDGMGLAPAVGSGRSIPGFNLYSVLESCKDYLVRFGGHDAAAGLTIENRNIDPFREAFCEIVSQQLSQEQRIAELFIDGVFPLGAFTRQAVEQIGQLAPFGCENARPIFAAQRVTVSNVKSMGKDNSHFSAEFRQGGVSVRGIAFSRSQWIREMEPYTDPFDIAFKVNISDYNRQVELNILDWRRSEP